MSEEAKPAAPAEKAAVETPAPAAPATPSSTPTEEPAKAGTTTTTTTAATATTTPKKKKQQKKKAKPAAEEQKDFHFNAEAPAFIPGGAPAPEQKKGKKRDNRQHPLQNMDALRAHQAAEAAAAAMPYGYQQQHGLTQLAGMEAAMGGANMSNPLQLQNYIAMQRRNQQMMQMQQQQQQQQHAMRMQSQQAQAQAQGGRNGAVQDLLHNAQRAQQNQQMMQMQLQRQGSGSLPQAQQQQMMLLQQQIAYRQAQAQAKSAAQQAQARHAAANSVLTPITGRQNPTSIPSIPPSPPPTPPVVAPPAAPPTPPSGGAVITIAGGRAVNFENISTLVRDPGAEMMKTLRRMTGRELSTLTVSERQASRGGATALAQFVVKPTQGEGAASFAEMPANTLTAFHNDLAAVLSALKDPVSIHISHGAWNWQHEPALYITCKNHKEAVLALDANASSNSTAPSERRDDITRYVTQIITDQEKFKSFRSASFVEAVGNAADMKQFYSLFLGAQREFTSFELRITGLTQGSCEIAMKTTDQFIPTEGFSFVQGTVVDFKALPTTPCQVTKEKQNTAKGAWGGSGFIGLGLTKKKH